MSRPTLFKAIRFAFIAGFTLVVVGAVTVYGLSSRKLNRQHTVSVREIPIDADATSIERGRHLVATRGCADCHGADFGGKKVIDDPMAGVLHGSNLTRGAGGLPADFNDMDFIRSIRHGITRDGRGLVLMPSEEYAVMSDEDLGDVIAFIKTVPPVDRPRGEVSPGPIIRLLLTLGEFKLSADEIDHSARQPASVTPAISPDYGKYLAASCTGCHGPNLSGGKIPGAPPHWPTAANLTTHASAGVSKWTEEQFLHAMRARQRPDGTAIDPVMPAAFGLMNDLELKALWTYLKTLPASEHGQRSS